MTQEPLNSVAPDFSNVINKGENEEQLPQIGLQNQPTDVNNMQSELHEIIGDQTAA